MRMFLFVVGLDGHRNHIIITTKCYGHEVPFVQNGFVFPDFWQYFFSGFLVLLHSFWKCCSQFLHSPSGTAFHIMALDVSVNRHKWIEYYLRWICENCRILDFFGAQTVMVCSSDPLRLCALPLAETMTIAKLASLRNNRRINRGSNLCCVYPTFSYIEEIGVVNGTHIGYEKKKLFVNDECHSIQPYRLKITEINSVKFHLLQK